MVNPRHHRAIVGLFSSALCALFVSCRPAAAPRAADAAANGSADQIEFASKLGWGKSGSRAIEIACDDFPVEPTPSVPYLYPTFVLAAGRDQMFIGDNNAHAIYKLSFALGAAALSRWVSGEHLQWPYRAAWVQKALYVSDIEGVKQFRDRQLVRTVKTFLQIHDFAVLADGSILLNPMFRRSSASHPLVLRTSPEGVKVSSYGRQSESTVGGLDNHAFVCHWTSSGSVAAVFARRPAVEIFDRGGRVARRVSIEHPAFEALQRLAGDRKRTNPRPGSYWLPRYVAGARLARGRLLVLLHLPSPEIVALDEGGSEVKRWRLRVAAPLVDYSGFDLADDIGGVWPVILGKREGDRQVIIKSKRALQL